MTIEEIIEDYNTRADTFAFRDRALFEREVWAAVRSRTNTGAMSMETWFADHLQGISNRDVRLRAALLLVDSDVDELWKRLDDKDISPSAALKLLYEARLKSKNDKIPLADALKKSLAKYDKLPFVSRSPDGYLYRKGRPKFHERQRKPKPGEPKTKKTYDSFWDDIRIRTENFLMSTLPHTDPVFVNNMRQELLVMLRVVGKDFKRVMSNALEADAHAATMEKFDLVSRHDVEEACATLKMEAPEKDEPVNIELAKRQKWRLANQYHPDKTSQDTAEIFNDVLKSYDLLEKYNSQHRKEEQNGDVSG